MMSEQAPNRRWFAAGCALTAIGSLGLISFPLTYPLSLVSDTVVFMLVCMLTVLMGIGATMAVFNLKRP